MVGEIGGRLPCFPSPDSILLFYFFLDIFNIGSYK
jgi:hypothetical protein